MRRDDPNFKLLAGKLTADDPLASQPTPSRFENAIAIPAPWKILNFRVGTGIERLREHHGGNLPDSLTLESRRRANAPDCEVPCYGTFRRTNLRFPR
jgi:hypothetical protein